MFYGNTLWNTISKMTKICINFQFLFLVRWNRAKIFRFGVDFVVMQIWHLSLSFHLNNVIKDQVYRKTQIFMNCPIAGNFSVGKWLRLEKANLNKSSKWNCQRNSRQENYIGLPNRKALINSSKSINITKTPPQKYSKKLYLTKNRFL